MILVLVMMGFIVGASAAGVALLGGGGVLLALAAYGLFGVGAVVFTALLLALAPALPAFRARAFQAVAPPLRLIRR